MELHNLSETVELAQFVESVEWELVHTTAFRRPSLYNTISWDHVYFRVTLRRKWLFQVLNVILPIVFISLLNILCFLLPAISGERVTLCISIFLSLAVFFTIVTSTMPESSDEVAIFGLYVGLQLLGSALTIFMTVLSLYFFYKDQKISVPRPFRILARPFQSITCTNRFIDNTKNVTEQCDGLDVAVVENSEVKSKVPVPVTVDTEDRDVTWVDVSHGVDRICIISSVIWHTILLVNFLHSVKS